ncbi:ABC transporter ATP-binding protein [Clostridium sp. 19966]|uniref:ABC transporter ATP-binding protein n=1 Tax=Clostridium sp. 19966 TaxID=2768166 RepID=UPI0028DD4AD6|nr:ABC transporter ATP-binding protein [Clostridium sp. 19966]MDT8717928.1 ABC transporter ATP-binding protein [Clostridium sp. 19966]
MLKVENLKKVYDTKVKKGLFKSERFLVEAVKGIDMEIKEGQIVGLLGINGAGKTTTIKMLSTLLSPTSGSINIDGLDVVKDSEEVKKRVNMVAGGERMLYWRLTGRENLKYYGELYNIDSKKLESRIDYLLDLVGLTEKQNLAVERYSKGMKQRLQIARGLINDPSYIFMDEPTLGLDAVIARELRKHVKDIAHNEGKAILLTSHYLQEVEELCEYIYILDSGKIIAQGTPKELSHIGMSHKVLCIEVDSLNQKLHQDIKRLCMSINGCSMSFHEENRLYTIKSLEDISTEVARILMENNMPIKSFYSKEPNLEDAIIKLSKGA